MRKTTLILAVALALFMTSSPAEARLILTIDDLSTGGVDVIVIDETGAGAATSKGLSTHADGFAGVGTVMFSGSVGTFIVQVTLGTSKPLPPNSPTLAHMDIFNISVSGGAGELQLMLTDTDFQLNLSKVGTWGGMDLHVGGTLNAGASVHSQGWIDNANAEFGMGNPTIMSDTFMGPGAFSGNYRTGPAHLIGNFSLTQSITLKHTVPGTSSFDSELQVPEPASAMLLALGLAGVVARRRRRNA